MKYSVSRKRLFTRQFWKTLELKHYSLFLLAVFFSFSAMGLVSDLLSKLSYSYSILFVAIISSGLVSAGYAYAATKNWWAFPITLLIQFAFILFLRQVETVDLTDEFLYNKSRFIGIGLMISVLLGYTFFVIFITKVGINHFLLKAEMSLAKEIHDVLVPEINYIKSGYEIYGKSIPTSEVGGDLIDVVENQNRLYCAIADVSGHGVSSGVYTGMFKSSLRTIIATKTGLDEILSEVNESLFPLTKKNMFITSSIIKFGDNSEAEFIIAGHLPLLHYNKNENSFQEHLIKQLPIGVKSRFNYKSDKIHFNKGDIFALITDGITETTDKKNSYFGIENVKKIIKENNDKSSEHISQSIFNEVGKYGIQKDDITLLIIKC